MEPTPSDRTLGARNWRPERPRAPRGAAVALAAFLVALAAAGCGAPPKPVAGVTLYDEAALDLWQGQLRDFFDDSIHPAAVGMSLDGAPPEEDPLLANRAVLSALVSRMRVSTVTRDAAGARVSYHLTLELFGEPLIAARAKSDKVELTIRQATPSFGIVSALEGSLRGRTFIGLLRWFAGDRGPELHWHLAADTPGVAALIGTTGVFEEAAQQ